MKIVSCLKIKGEKLLVKRNEPSQVSYVSVNTQRKVQHLQLYVATTARKNLNNLINVGRSSGCGYYKLSGSRSNVNNNSQNIYITNLL